MPIAETDLLMAPGNPYQVALEPAHNNLYSLLLLTQAEQLLGLDPWITQTRERLSPEEQHRNRLVIEGLYHTVFPARSYPSFPSYLTDLAAADPFVLRDRLVHETLRGACEIHPALSEVPSVQDMLADQAVYLDFLARYWPVGGFDPEIESEVHTLLQNPQRMHALILDHLRTMWQSCLAPEWERSRPLLQESVDAFRRIDLRGLEPHQAAEQVLGRELPGEKWSRILADADQVVFVPSRHTGPYLRGFSADKRVWLFFGARLPEGITYGGSALSRSELLVRLNTLTDDTRLQVLALLAEHGERCAQDLIVDLDISQSSVSRHLRQLIAAGFVSERWRDGSKCYQLNQARIGDTLRALEQFFRRS
ncbi:MAG: winged helix-turn-helix transcriptional regulator [Oscillochloris sp.]|nr:winged helix-turn-helix transcriptional regulator [Oscillochloris sp.]